MRLRSTTRESGTDGRSTATGPAGGRAAGSTSSGGLVRKLLVLSLGVAAVAYAVSRYGGVPDDFEAIPIGDRDEAEIDRSEEGPPTEDAKSAADEDVDATESETETTPSADTNDVIDGAETNVDITDEERSSEKIAERADEETPEPGEMAVDEAVADELVDEETDSSGGEETDEE